MSIYSEHLKIASRRFALYGIPADLRLADAESLPFEDGTFDAVYTFGVIHHTPNTQKAVEEIHRVLKPGGRAIIGVYHKYSAFFLSAVLLESYLLRLGFLRESYRRTLSKIEVRQHSDACPLVKVYSRRTLRRSARRPRPSRSSPRTSSGHTSARWDAWCPTGSLVGWSADSGWAGTSSRGVRSSSEWARVTH